jgi:hypothetical protein
MENFTQWESVANAPLDRDLELAVIDAAGVHSLIFPCRLNHDVGWFKAGTSMPVLVHPTHWRDWQP